jgi:hypothetical protein
MRGDIESALSRIPGPQSSDQGSGGGDQQNEGGWN